MKTFRVCSGCHARSGEVRLMRARRFLIELCDQCSLSLPVIDEGGREFRLIAVATASFAHHTEKGSS